MPVYALGQSEDGRPFYAMRFVKGDSLKRALEDFHNPNNPNRKDPGTRQLALRQLLGRFIDVCLAVEYARSRGVLHRDLKPGNIMVGKYGETLVVDWGLAKALGKRDVGTDDATLRPSSALSSSVQTQPGSAIGTPAYMSPEQAVGKLDGLGPTTDVCRSSDQTSSANRQAAAVYFKTISQRQIGRKLESGPPSVWLSPAP